MIVRHVLIGAVFTFVGLVSLLTPEIPFICIGALVFGPLELMVGLFGNERRRAVRPPAAYQPAVLSADAAPGTVPRRLPPGLCPACGMRNDGLLPFCRNCGTQLG